MRIKQTALNFLTGLFLLLSVTIFLSPVIAFAAGNNGCEVDTAIIECKNVNVDADGYENTGLWSILLFTVNLLTAGVGVVALAGIVYGSILYTSSGGSQEQVKKAITVFTNVAIGVVAFAGMWALLNFLIPGGVLQ